MAEVLNNLLSYLPIVGDAMQLGEAIIGARSNFDFNLLMRNLENINYDMDRGFYIQKNGVYYRIYDDRAYLLGIFRNY
jgi:hypothetical protein